MHLVASGVTPKQLLEEPETVDLPDSVVGFLHGELGTPPGGFPEPFRSNAIEGRTWEPHEEELSAADAAGLAGDDRRATLNRLLFPGPSADQAEKRERYGNLAVLPSPLFWYGLDPHDDEASVGLGRGVRLLLGLRSVGQANEDGIRRVSFVVNGQTRDIDTRDRSVASDRPETERVDPTKPGHVGAPFRGVVNISVQVGDEVAAGDTVAVIEAMKMECRSPRRSLARSNVSQPWPAPLLKVATSSSRSGRSAFQPAQ